MEFKKSYTDKISLKRQELSIEEDPEKQKILQLDLDILDLQKKIEGKRKQKKMFTESSDDSFNKNYHDKTSKDFIARIIAEAKMFRK